MAVEPASNILCFRHVPPRIRNAGNAPERLDEHQSEVRQRVVASGRYFLVQTVLRNKIYLRTTLMNPSTKVEDLKGLIEAIRDSGRSADLQVSKGTPT